MTRRLAVLLVLVAALVPAVLAGCGGDDESEATPPAADTAVADGGAEAPADPEGDAAAGKAVFAEAGCGNCHTLADAGTAGAVGPDLDQLGAGFDAVVEQVTSGGGGMPAFEDELSEQQILDVAAYVTSVTGG